MEMLKWTSEHGWVKLHLYSNEYSPSGSAVQYRTMSNYVCTRPLSFQLGYMPSKRGKQLIKSTRWLMFFIVDTSGAYWAFHGATTSQMTKWWHDLNKWHCTTQWRPEEDDLVIVGHILRLPTTRPASLALEWIPEGDRRRVGRPKRTWQDTLKEDLDILGVDWSDGRDTAANDRARWRQLVAQCSAQNGRN